MPAKQRWTAKKQRSGATGRWPPLEDLGLEQRYTKNKLRSSAELEWGRSKWSTANEQKTYVVDVMPLRLLHRTPFAQTHVHLSEKCTHALNMCSCCTWHTDNVWYYIVWKNNSSKKFAEIAFGRLARRPTVLKKPAGRLARRPAGIFFPHNIVTGC